MWIAGLLCRGTHNFVERYNFYSFLPKSAVRMCSGVLFLPDMTTAEMPAPQFSRDASRRRGGAMLCGGFVKIFFVVSSFGEPFSEMLHGESTYTPRRIGLHSTENRPTLHVVSAHAPRSIFEENRRHGQVPHGEAVERVAWFARRRASFAELRPAGQCREKFGV